MDPLPSSRPIRRPRAITYLACAIMTVLATSWVHAQDHLTKPQAATTTQPSSNRTQIEKWFAQLAHHEPAEREQARVALMGLRRPDLSTLLDVVRQTPFMAPSQRMAL